MSTTASYPNQVASFGPDRIDLQSVVVASDVNPVYAEIVSIETILGLNVHKRQISWNSGSFSSSVTSFSTLQARLENIENGVYAWSTTGITGSGGAVMLGTNGVNLTLKQATDQTVNLLEFRTSNNTSIGYMTTAGKLEVVSIDGGTPSSNFS
jgi:hypothetical protein